jgi:hypothetical protein
VRGQTEDGLLSILREAVAVIHLDVEHADVHRGVHVGGLQLAVMHLEDAIRTPTGGHAHPTREVLVDQQPVGEEDVRLEVVERIPDAPHIPRGAGVHAHERLAPDRGVPGLGADDLRPVEAPLAQARRRHVEVRLEAQHPHMLGGAVGLSAEQMDDRLLCARVLLDRVVHLHDPDRDVLGHRLGHGLGGGRLPRWPVGAGDRLGLPRGTLIIGRPEVAESGLSHVPTQSTDQELARAEVPVPVPAVDRIEAYEVDEGVVLYDPQNPLAWLETSAPVDLTLLR